MFMQRNITLRLSWWHLGVWLSLATVAGSLALWGCVEYNKVAGTDKTPFQMAVITGSVLIGPMIGPVANGGAGEQFERQAFWLTVFLMAGVVASLSPFLLVRRQVSRAVAALCWLIYIAMSAAWYFASLVALTVFLS